MKGQVHTMKPIKLAASLLAAFTAAMPFSLNTSVLLSSPAVFAESTDTALPDWVPNDLESAVEFRNTYGATHIEDGLICLVLQEAIPDDTDSGSEERYALKTTEGLAEILYRTTYDSPYDETAYEVIVFKPLKKGDFEVALIDTWLKMNLQGSKAKYEFTFMIRSDLSVRQTDIYGWLPDCTTEYVAYTRENGTVSVRENYVVFCLTSIPQFSDRWEPDSSNQYENLRLCASSDCTMESVQKYDDGSIDMVYAYKAFNDGYEKISWVRNSGARPDQQEPLTVTADCAIFNDAESVLLADTARISLIEYDTGKLIPLDQNPIPLAPTVAYQSDEEGVYAYADVSLIADKNPYLWDLTPYQDADLISIDLFPSALPEPYTPTENYKSIRKFDNGAQEVIFFLKEKGSITKKYTANITLLDYDTDKPIIINSDTEFMLVEPEYYWDYDTESAIVAKISSNPCRIDNMSLDGCELEMPMHYDYPVKDGTNQVASGYRTMKTNASGGYDITYRLKFTPTGDLTGDRRFNAEDLAEMQKRLSGDHSAAKNWKAVDYNRDDKLDARDLTLMKTAYITKRQTPVAVRIRKTGGVMGMNLEWNVYAENGKYYLSSKDRNDRYVNGKPVPNETEIIEITEEEYLEIISADYDTLIEDYNAAPHMRVSDDIYEFVFLTFPDGSERAGLANLSDILDQIDRIITKYKPTETWYSLN